MNILIKNIIILILFLNSLQLFSQNILKNGDFEQFKVTVPNEGKPLFWEEALPTYDYYNTPFHPYNPTGFTAYSGTGHLGIGAWESSGVEGSESLYQHLKEKPIKKGITYKVSIYVKKALSGFYNFQRNIGKISIYGNNKYKRRRPIENKNHVKYMFDTELLWISDFIVDSSWTLLEGCFKAKRDLNYIYISAEAMNIRNNHNYFFIDLIEISSVVDLGRDTVICSDDSFVVSAINKNATNYKWHDNSTYPTFTVTKPGIYWVDVSSSCGVIRDSIVVKHCPPTIKMPNVFTPNSDNINDYFKPIKVEGILNPTFLIYNRWGQIVFESSSLKKGWNGKKSGKECSAGTYYWVVKNFNEKDLKGSLTLFR